MNKSVFDIHAEVARLMSEVEMSGEDMTDEQEIKLGELQVDMRTKILATAMWARGIKAEITGAKEMKKELDARIKTAENTEKRLKVWIRKQAELAKLVTGNDEVGWKGEKIQTDQIQVTWRKSEEVVIADEDDPNFSKLYKNFPQYFKFTVSPCNVEGGRELDDLIKEGLVEMIGMPTASKTELKKAIGGTVKISGVKVIKKLNPQIKV